MLQVSWDSLAKERLKAAAALFKGALGAGFEGLLTELDDDNESTLSESDEGYIDYMQDDDINERELVVDSVLESSLL